MDFGYAHTQHICYLIVPKMALYQFFPGPTLILPDYKDKDGSASDKHGDNGILADNRHENSALFDQDQLELYERHFVEGYNLFADSDYVNWLQLYHP